MTHQVRGRDQITGLPRTITVNSTDVVQAIQDSLQAIIGAVRSVLERTPPELASDIMDRGIVLTGGTAQLRNLDRMVTQEIGISCYMADTPLECVAMGAGIALDHLELIKRAQPPEGEWLVSY
jgi:rod shape-determining protein MreB